MNPDLPERTWTFPATRSPDLTIRLDRGGVIRQTDPAPAHLAGRALQPGQNLAALFPDVPEWAALPGTRETDTPWQIDLGGTQVTAYLQGDGDDLHLGLWERQAGLPDVLDHLALAQHALITAQTVSGAAEALLTYLHAQVYGALLSLHDPQEEVLVTRAGLRSGAARVTPCHHVPLDADLPAAEVFRTGRELLLDRQACEQRYPALVLAPDTCELIALPLQTRDRRLGTLLLSLDTPAAHDPALLTRLRMLASFGAVALDRAHLFESLHLAGERYRTLLETTHAFVWETDADFQVRRPLPQWEVFTGRPFESYRGLGYLDCLLPEARTRYLHVIRDARTNPRHVTFDLPVVGADGAFMYGQVHAVPIHGPDGQLRAWMGTMADVTERRQMERRQGIIQQVLQQLGSAVEPQDLLHAVMHAARAACQGQAAQVVRLTGGNAVHRLAQQFQDPPGDPDGVPFPASADTLRAALESGVPTWLTPDGALCPDQLPRAPAPSPGRHGPGRPGAVLAVPLRADPSSQLLLLIGGAAAPLPPDARDHLQWIQPYLGQAAQRALLVGTLKRREEQGRHIIDALDEALVLCAEDGTVQQVNGPALQLAGLDRLENFPNIFDPAWQLHGPDGHLLEPSEYPAFTALQTGAPVRDALIRRHTPGGVQWMSMNAVPWQHDDGRRGVIVSVKDVTEPHLLRRQLEVQAQQDELTGLPNRRGFNQAVQALTEHPAGGAVLLLDLDRFKLVNDTYGHHIGDALLQVVARRLQTQVRDGLCSRLAGDEFGVVLPGVTARAARELTSHLLPLLEHPVSLRGVTLHPQVSIGLCVNTDVTWDAAAWFKGADLALHDAKQQGRSRWREYTEVLEQRHVRRVAIEDRLRLALQAQALTVEYQPIEKRGRPGWQYVEALARWDDPELGRVAPSEFIPVAEEAGLITGLGEQILRMALQQVNRWSQVTRQPVCVHVNVSGGEMTAPDFAHRVAQILRETGCRPSQLIAELTESEAVGDVQSVIRQLNALQALGVRIALDDFGTGHSSLSMLEQLPVDSVKIDRAFVHHIDVTPRRQSLLSAMLRMGEELGVEVIVEGVETPIERQVLDHLGVQFVQGYQVSRPLPASQLRPGPDGLHAVRNHPDPA